MLSAEIIGSAHFRAIKNLGKKILNIKRFANKAKAGTNCFHLPLYFSDDEESSDVDIKSMMVVEKESSPPGQWANPEPSNDDNLDPAAFAAENTPLISTGMYCIKI